METSNGIKKLAVEGLHEQFDVELDFKPGLNIIYGKNGKGKTTVLHILANALELDFKRFRYLSFRRIFIETFAGQSLEISKKSDPDRLELLVNREMSILASGQEGVSAEDIATLRDVFGERSTYLPAFRSVLERVRDEAGPYYRERTRDVNVDELELREFEFLKENFGSKRARDLAETRAFREEASITARKTIQCRQWFGPFVPTIRYPSIIEVDDGLTSEWRTAQLSMAAREQNMFADVFVQVFRTIVGMENPHKPIDIEEALKSIVDSLDNKDYQLGDRQSEQISAQLKDVMVFLRGKPAQESKGIEQAVLALYLEKLVERKEARKNALQSSREFESSINTLFGKQKNLKIGEKPAGQPGRSSVTVATEGGRSYSLSALSSGERQILTMLYSASRSRFRKGIFLIDEPELSLHIDWQRMILKELMALAPNRQIIACTHSPEVGADHFEETQDFEPRITRRPQDDLFDSEIESTGEDE